MTRAVVEAALAGAAFTYAAAELVELARGQCARPGPARLLSSVANRLMPAQATPGHLRSRALQAGLGHWADDLYSLKLGAALVGALLTLPVLRIAAIGPGLVVLAVLAGAAFMAPDIVLWRRIAWRRAQIATELPTVLDLLVVAVGAGLPIATALERVAGHNGGTLSAELRRAQRALATGAQRSDAMRSLRDRCPHEGVAALVAAIDRSDRHGARLAPALQAIAADARRHRARAIYERSARAAPQIQLVIALGLVPATMLIVAAVLIASL